MKSIRGHFSCGSVVSIFLPFALIFVALAPPAALAQAASKAGQSMKNNSEDGGKDKSKKEDFDKDDVSNPPPFDFNDAFYTANGINVQQLNTRAGALRDFPQDWPSSRE